MSGGFAVAGCAGVPEVGRDSMRPTITDWFSAEEALGD